MLSAIETAHLSRVLIRDISFIQMISRRGVRSQRLMFRTKLPKYKVNLKTLPPLTGHLTDQSKLTDHKTAIELRLSKLEIYKEYLPVNSNTNLIEALFHPDNDIDRLLKIIDENLPTMTSFYVALCFETIDDMLRAGLCETSTVAVAPEFRRLCDRSLLKMRFFEADEVLKLVKCLSIMEVPEDTLLVQAVFQMARELINDFTIKELGALSHSLEMFHPIIESNKSLLKVLKAAIKIARKNQIEAKLLQETESPIDSDRVLLRDH